MEHNSEAHDSHRAAVPPFVEWMSAYGTSRHFAATQHFGRFRSERTL